MKKEDKRGWIHKAQYYETDQMGIVHHSNYIRWFEEARTDYMRSMGYPYKRMEEEKIICPVLEIHCKYRLMVHFEDEVRIEAKISAFNGVKLCMEYEIYDHATDELKTTGSSIHCFLDDKGKPVSLKRSYPAIYEVFLKAFDKDRSQADYYKYKKK